MQEKYLKNAWHMVNSKLVVVFRRHSEASDLQPEFADFCIDGGKVNSLLHLSANQRFHQTCPLGTPAGLVVTMVRSKQGRIAEEARDWQRQNRGSFLGTAQLHPLRDIIFLELAAIGLDLSDETGPF